MKKLLMAIVLMPMLASAYQFWTDPDTDITWTYVVRDDGSVSLGDDSDSAVPSSWRGALTLPADIKGRAVTRIGERAFSSCSGLTSVTIPSSVTSVGDMAFSSCSGLTSVTIPLGVTSIGEDAFSGCIGLTSVTIPEGVGVINGWTFFCCWGLTSLRIPLSVRSIGDCAFAGCSGLTSVTIPSSVKSIGYSAFSGCSRLATIEILEGLTSIGDSVFENCDGLTSVEIPNSVSGISGKAFKNCMNIVSVTMPGCFALKDVFPFSSTKIRNVTILDGEKALSKDVFAECCALTKVTIAEGVTTLGEDLFRGLKNLNELTIPSTLTSIGDNALYGCSSLKVIRVSNNGNIDAVKRLLQESGFDIERVAFDHVRFDVSFAACGGILDRTCSEVLEGAMVGELPTARRTGYTFLGWFTAAVGGTQVTAETVVTKDVTYYAHWKANEYTVMFDANGGEGTMDPQKFVYDEEQALATNGFTHELSTFKGWAVARVDTGSTMYGDGEVVSNLTAEADGVVMLHARWRTRGWRIRPGESVGLDTGLIGYAASGLPSGLKYNKLTGMITGMARKPTAAEGVVVKFTKKGVDPEERVIVVTAIPKVTVAMVGVNAQSDTNGCKVTGTGAYLVGKKVSLKATAPKGVVFKGWFDGAEGVVATQNNYSFTMDKEDVSLVAKFEKEKMSVGCAGLAEGSFMVGVAGSAEGIPLEIETQSGVKSVKVVKLPSGMKYDSKTGKITGAPTKAGKNKVEITVTAVSGAVEKREIEIEVAPIPAWAVGTFSGYVESGDCNGSATMTAGATGKISGKIVINGKAWTFSAASYAPASSADEMLVRAAAKSGKETRMFDFFVMPGEDAVEGSGLQTAYVFGELEPCYVWMYRNVWKDKGAAQYAAKLKGLYTARLEGAGSFGYLSIKADAKGGLKATGKLPDGTSVSSSLVLGCDEVAEGTFFAVWTLTPSSYKGGSVSGRIDFGNETPRQIGGGCQWSNFSPTATDEYGSGFFNDLYVGGAYYNAGEGLEQHYTKLHVALDPPELEVNVKYVDEEEDDSGRVRKVSHTEREGISAAVSVGGIVSVGAGGKLTIPKAAKPVQDRETKEWYYGDSEEENVSALTLSFAKATGIFKGSVTCWYDYMSAFDSTKEEGAKYTHTSKKISFEGIWVQGQSLAGFYLWDRTGSYWMEKPNGDEVEKTFKYKQSCPVTLE